MLDYIQREGFTEVIISTPGPIGITALLAAKMLHLRTVGIYHTDFPQYVQILTDDHIYGVARVALHVLVLSSARLDLRELRAVSDLLDRARPSKATGSRSCLAAWIPGSSIQNAGIPNFWLKRGARTGRVDPVVRRAHLAGKESRCFRTGASVRARRPACGCARLSSATASTSRPLQRLLPDACFTGYLAGEDLARAYASADIFVFPSISDTFGNVVIEAQASGLPVIVSDQKGPQELVENGRHRPDHAGFGRRRRRSGHPAARSRDPDLSGAGWPKPRGGRSRAAVGRRPIEKFWSMSPP